MLHPFQSFSTILIIGWAAANVPSSTEVREDAGILGHLPCDLDADSLAISGQNFLKLLNQCKSFTPDQIKAIQDLLSSGNTPFGLPSTWSSSTLNELTGLLQRLPQSILQNIPKEVLIPWLKRGRLGAHLPREPLPSVVERLRMARRKRASDDCPPDKVVTEEVLLDKLMPIYYTPEELGACLKGQFLLDHLALVTSHAYTDRQMFELKRNLDREFPGGYPEWVLSDLGVLLEIMSEDEIKKWNITASETLRSLLGSQPTDNLAFLIIQKYVAHGNPLNAAALDAIGPRYICLLKEDQLARISEEAIKMAKSLQISRCSQTTVNTLYPKAKRAFSDRHNEFPAYFNLMKPYLRGAPAEDLKALSKSPVNMDIETFMTLRNDTLMKLTPSEVKGLLGRNAEELKNFQSEFPIRDWIHKQMQTDLDILGIRGGIPVGYINLTRAQSRKRRQVPLASQEV